MPSEHPKSFASPWASIDLATFLRPSFSADVVAPQDIDVLVVGSGYGGAMAVHQLAGLAQKPQGVHPLNIVLLERGEAYEGSDFPQRFADLPGHMRFSSANQTSPQGKQHGLFDIRSGPDLNVLLANGLGGGSLINAGVLAKPLPDVFAQNHWPNAIRQDGELDDMQDAVLSLLGGTHSGVFIERQKILDAMAAGADRPQADTVFLSITPPAKAPDGTPLPGTCIACGDCFTGCTQGAKLSLDKTLLASAASRHPRDHLKIVTGATVLHIAPETPNDAATHWLVKVVHTNARARQTQSAPYVLRTRTLILAAGALGSTEILLKSRSNDFPVSPRLGQKFSSNGDSIAFVHGHELESHAVANPLKPLAKRHVGPTITRNIDLRRSHGMVVQDLGIPASLRQVFEEITHTWAALHRLAQADNSVHSGSPALDPARIHPQTTDKSMMVALIGHDHADGVLRLPPNSTPDTLPTDGAVQIHWPTLKLDPRFAQRYRQFRSMVLKTSPHATVIANPGHQPLPEALEKIYGDIKGPLLSVHPLGGCAMAEHPTGGVVNHLGQVFCKQDNDSVYEHLLVLDGSIVPCSLGINPALTIATLAYRSINQLKDTWGLVTPQQQVTATPSVLTNESAPNTRPDIHATPDPTPTSIASAELLWGMCELDLKGQTDTYLVELELWFKPVEVKRLIHASADAEQAFELDSRCSELRIFKLDNTNQAYRQASNERPRGTRLMSASISGNLSWLPLAASKGPINRAIKSLPIWLLNRGLSDTVKGLIERINASPRGGESIWQELSDKAQSAWNLATHAGQVRHMVYDLTIGTVKGLPNDAIWSDQHWGNRPIKALKTIAYTRHANPINQMMAAQLLACPNLVRSSNAKQAILQVDPSFWGHVKLPFVRITSQENHAAALLDTVSLLLFTLRALLPTHVWSMRLPDRPLRPVPTDARLPSALPNLGAPDIHVLTFPGTADGKPIEARLSRYRMPQLANDQPPVLLIHGYSASGTTFAHEALPEGGLAGYLAARQRDVWVLDLRSSSGLPTATQPWSFEDMAHQDIPRAVELICQLTGEAQIDVVAHCMGAAMLTLALLGNQTAPHPPLGAERLRRIVFSQVGPAMRVSPANAARAHVIQWLRYYLSLNTYELTPTAPTPMDDMLDRVLSLVPYPPDDFSKENPWFPPWKRTPWVSTRHRMDSYFGVTFKLDQMPDQVLARLDEFFGPIHLETLADVLHYAQTRLVTDVRGFPIVDPYSVNTTIGSIEKVMSLHSSDNQMISPKTADFLTDLFKSSGIAHDRQFLDGMGHQDSLIGKRAETTYHLIHVFLAEQRT